MAATRGDRGLMWWLLAAVGLQLTWCSASHAQYLPRYGGRSRKGIKDLWQGQVSMKRARGSSLWSSPGIVSRRRLQTGSNTTTAQSNPSASGVGAWDPTLQPLGLGPLMNLSATRQVSESGVPDLGGARYTVRLVEASTPITVAVRACLANGRQYQTYLANEMATDTAPLQVPPFATRNTSEKSGYFGLAAEMMAMMAAELNFTYEFVGPSSDGHYLQGAMDDVFFGNADVAIGPVPPSQAYFDQVDYTDSYYSSGLHLLTLVPSQTSASTINSSNLISWTDPFGAGLWGVVVGMITMYGIVMYYIEKGEADFEDQYGRGWNGLWKSMWLSFLTFAGQVSGHAAGTLAGRIFNSTSAFVAVILISSYTANLANFLTADKLAASTFTTLSEASANSISICAVAGGTADEYVTSVYPALSLIKVDGKGVQEEIENTFTLLRNNTCQGAVLDEVIASVFLKNSSFCDVQMVGTVFAKTPYVLGIRKLVTVQDPAKQDMLQSFMDATAFFFAKIRDDGNMSMLHKKYIENDGSACPAASTSSGKISVAEVLGPLILLLVIAVSATAHITMMCTVALMGNEEQQRNDRDCWQ